eukprot:c6828_g1_i1 orf=128-334(+)
MPSRGSVRQIQAHVIQTRLGHGQSSGTKDGLDQSAHNGVGYQLQKPPHQTGVLRQKHQRGRHRVRYEG